MIGELMNNNSKDVPVVSVIMNCLNGDKYLKQAIDSIYAQTFQDWEIIFWEDLASNDRSGEIVQSYDKKLIHIKADVSVPLYAARNLAIKKAKGDYVAFLDCDDMWMPSKLEDQLSLFKKDREVGLVYSDAILFNEQGKEKRLFAGVSPARGNVFSELLFGNFINMQTVMISKPVLEFFDRCFDDRLNMMGDFDAWLRISYKWKIDYVNKALVKYRVHANNMTTTRGPELIGREVDLILENLVVLDPDFKIRYSAQARALLRMRDVKLSLIDWESGDRENARLRIRRYTKDGLVYSVLFLLMFFPHRFVFRYAYRFYNKGLTV